jgi:GTPase SAR1 family protein
MEENRVRKLMFKVILIGEIAVGKTSVMRRFVHRKFEGNTKGTIGADFMVKGNPYQVYLYVLFNIKKYLWIINS